MSELFFYLGRFRQPWVLVVQLPSDLLSFFCFVHLGLFQGSIGKAQCALKPQDTTHSIVRGYEGRCDR